MGLIMSMDRTTDLRYAPLLYVEDPLSRDDVGVYVLLNDFKNVSALYEGHSNEVGVDDVAVLFLRRVTIVQ